MTCEISKEQTCSIKSKVWCKSTTATTGYSKGDGCMLLGCDGLDSSTVVLSLTDEPNNDRPIDGIRKTPPTWKMKTLCEMIKEESVRDNGDGTFTFINADGTEGASWVGTDKDTDTDTDTFGSVLNNGDGTFTFINADGSTGPTWIGTDEASTTTTTTTTTPTLRPNANFKWLPTIDANKIATLEEPVTTLDIFEGHDGMTDNGNGGIVIPKDGSYIVSVSGGTIWLIGTPRTLAEGAVNADYNGFALDLDGVGIGGTGTQEWTYAREGSKIHQGISVGFTATAGQVLTLRTLMGASNEGHVSIGGLKGFVAWQSDV